jgi:tetratricopeptide (TPR) repeat protein
MAGGLIGGWENRKIDDHSMIAQRQRAANSQQRIAQMVLFSALLCSLCSLRCAPAVPHTDLSQGVTAFEERRWSDAMGAFLEVLCKDPANTSAHSYIVLIARELEAQRQAFIRERRLKILVEASKRLEQIPSDATRVQQAILETRLSGQTAHEDLWRSRCEEARLERTSGHLLAANDLVFQVLAENASFPEAQRELSDIQSEIRKTLDAGESPAVIERYALEGFYAFGQADYAGSLTAWTKVRTLLSQTHSGAEMNRDLSDLRFSPYEKVAQAHVDEDNHLRELSALFERGVGLYNERRFSQSLDELRKLAIREPDYPQLGYYLVQAEAGSEQERARRLGEEKRQEIERTLSRGLAALDNEKLAEAERCFQKVLELDPSHPQVRTYLAMVQAEIQRRHDPKAAQMHYEAGLIAYASGKLDEAMREWHLATRMNSRHEKALVALAKVQKEIALNHRELTDEAIP